MYGIFTYIYHEVMINVGKYSIHGAVGLLGKRTTQEKHSGNERLEPKVMKVWKVMFFPFYLAVIFQVPAR